MDSSQNAVSFISITCPSCGGELMLSKKLEKAICNYCGKSFVISKDLGKSEASADKFIKLAKIAQSSKNLEEAYGYFSKALELEPDNNSGLIGKAQVVGWLSTLDNPRIDEAVSYYREAAKYIPRERRNSLRIQASMDIANMSVSYALAGYNVFKEIVEGYEEDLDIYNEFRESLGSSWNIFLGRIMFAFSRLDIVITNIVDEDDRDQFLSDMLFICNFILDGVVEQYRMEWEGPIQTFYPFTFLYIDQQLKQKFEEYFQRYFSLITADDVLEEIATLKLEREVRELRRELKGKNTEKEYARRNKSWLDRGKEVKIKLIDEQIVQLQSVIQKKQLEIDRYKAKYV